VLFIHLKLALYLVAGVAVVCGAIGRALWGPRAQARRRLRAGSAALVDHTIATVTGEVRRPAVSLFAPLSGRPCVCFAVSGRFRGPDYKKVLAEIGERGATPFELALGDGSIVLIDAADVELAVAARPLIPRSLDREAAFAARHGHKGAALRWASFDEAVVEAGDRIAVQGLVVVDERPATTETGYREAGRALRVVAHPAHPLTIGPAR
jgi:hypothetical protein